MERILALMIPILAVSIPLVVVAGRFIVQPIVTALSRNADGRNTGQIVGPLSQRLEAAEDRIQELERSLDRVVQEQAFERQLRTGRSGNALTE